MASKIGDRWLWLGLGTLLLSYPPTKPPLHSYTKLRHLNSPRRLRTPRSTPLHPHPPLPRVPRRAFVKTASLPRHPIHGRSDTNHPPRPRRHILPIPHPPRPPERLPSRTPRQIHNSLPLRPRPFSPRSSRIRRTQPRHPNRRGRAHVIFLFGTLRPTRIGN